jgi:hypothetical protein
MDRATAPEKKGFRHNPQHDGWPIHRFISSFSPEPTIEAVGVKLPSVDGRLLGLPDPYHWHAISTFNTYSRGPTHRPLTDTGGATTLKVSALHIPLPDIPNRWSSPFPLRAPLGLWFNNPPTKLEFDFKRTYGRHVVFWPLDHLPWPITMPSHS